MSMIPRRVLVAHDFSPCSDEAGRAAARDLLRGRQGGTIVLGHIFEIMPLPGGAADILGTGMTKGAAAVECTRKLERAAEELRRAIDGMRRAMFEPPTVEVEVAVRQGTPAEGILALAIEQHTTRIVVGSHGRRGLAHLILGSVAERVARTSRIPVLIVKNAAA